MRILRKITITITSMTNYRSLLKYFFVLLILFISAAILST
ncbi:BAX protein, partial [Francisella tularensis subsp. holarctica]|nr:BAX protein [Francisella tularensis subsp. holarctica]